MNLAHNNYTLKRLQHQLEKLVKAVKQPIKTETETVELEPVNQTPELPETV